MADFWEDLGGGVKAALFLGVLAAVGLVAYYRMSAPTAEEIQRNDALRNVSNQR